MPYFAYEAFDCFVYQFESDMFCRIGLVDWVNYTDFTLRPNDPPVQMKVKGTESTVTWSSSNVNVATVDSSGMVKRVGKGTATITAQVDGQTLTCIVRVS